MKLINKILYKCLSKKKRAVLTVEACFIVPLILGIIFSVFIMTFYLHDRVIIKSYSCNIINGFYDENISSSKNNGFYHENISNSKINGKKIKKTISEKLWILKIVEVNYSHGKIRDKVSISAEYKSKNIIIKKFLLKADVKVDRNILCITPAESLFIKGAKD